MNARDIDSRDSPDWPGWPVYRVYFWDKPSALANVIQEKPTLYEKSYHVRRVDDFADVAEAIDWARATAKSDQTFTLYVEHRDAYGSILIPLMGDDPTEGKSTSRPGLGVLSMTLNGEKTFYDDAHIAGVQDGNLVIADGPTRMNGATPFTDVRREIPVAEIHRVEIVEEATDW